MAPRHCTKCGKQLPTTESHEVCRRCALNTEQTWKKILTAVGTVALGTLVVVASASKNSRDH